MNKKIQKNAVRETKMVQMTQRYSLWSDLDRQPKDPKSKEIKIISS